MDARTQTLEEGGATAPRPSLRALLVLAWPIIVSRSTQVVVGLGDAVMVAHLGDAGLAATVTGAFNTFTLLILPMGIVFIVSSFASQLTGRGDAAGARRYGFQGLVVAAGAGVLGLAGIPLLGPVLGALGYAPDVLALMTTYLVYRLPSALPAIGLEALSNYYGGIGNTALPMRASVLAMVLDLAGNWLLIGGNWGFPAMGVAGAALTSTISSWVAFLGLLLVFLRDQRRAEGRLVPELRLAELGRLLRFGVPSGLNWFFEFLAFSFFVNVVMAGLGTTALAAFMVVMQVNSVAFMPSCALASAGAILVGQSIGAGRKQDVPRIVGLTFGSAALWQGVAGLFYVAMPALLFAPFAREPSSREALLEVGARMLALSAAWQLFDAACGTLAESLRAAGDTAFTLWARVVLAWVVFAPGSWLHVRVLGGGDVAAVAWVIAYIALLALVLWLRFRSGAWRRIDLVGEAPVV